MHSIEYLVSELREASARVQTALQKSTNDITSLKCNNLHTLELIDEAINRYTQMLHCRREWLRSQSQDATQLKLIALRDHTSKLQNLADGFDDLLSKAEKRESVADLHSSIIKHLADAGKVSLVLPPVDKSIFVAEDKKIIDAIQNFGAILKLGYIGDVNSVDSLKDHSSNFCMESNDAMSSHEQIIEMQVKSIEMQNMTSSARFENIDADPQSIITEKETIKGSNTKVNESSCPWLLSRSMFCEFPPGKVDVCDISSDWLQSHSYHKTPVTGGHVPSAKNEALKLVAEWKADLQKWMQKTSSPGNAVSGELSKTGSCYGGRPSLHDKTSCAFSACLEKLSCAPSSKTCIQNDMWLVKACPLSDVAACNSLKASLTASQSSEFADSKSLVSSCLVSSGYEEFLGSPNVSSLKCEKSWLSNANTAEIGMKRRLKMQSPPAFNCSIRAPLICEKMSLSHSQSYHFSAVLKHMSLIQFMPNNHFLVGNGMPKRMHVLSERDSSAVSGMRTHIDDAEMWLSRPCHFSSVLKHMNSIQCMPNEQFLVGKGIEYRRPIKLGTLPSRYSCNKFSAQSSGFEAVMHHMSLIQATPKQRFLVGKEMAKCTYAPSLRCPNCNMLGLSIPDGKAKSFCRESDQFDAVLRQLSLIQRLPNDHFLVGIKTEKSE